MQALGDSSSGLPAHLSKEPLFPVSKCDGQKNFVQAVLPLLGTQTISSMPFSISTPTITRHMTTNEGMTICQTGRVKTISGVLKASQDGRKTVCEQGRVELYNGPTVEWIVDGIAELLWKDMENSDYEETLCSMGTLYAQGALGLPRDLGRATNLYERAVLKGSVRALFNLAVLREEGKGDVAGAFNLYRQAASKGVAKAWYRMALIYQQDKGVLRGTRVRVRELYERAASEDLPEGMFALARMYERGEGGLPKNLVKARKLYEQAAKKGHAEARNALAAMSEETLTESNADDRDLY